ncbi:MAG: polysaccharide deacetylase [Alphaproteobacteria bacterium]|jgi:peptidoglycan/xylan/chitin deacetylase (PgdA/CDA1 family)|nr:ribulose phosphate epimerase [Rhodospirillaceae bacterium]MDP6404208.1 polysaccharide deacetylase [Alphaproteobacteria bacterium]MDP6623383.1 polysaccharide deacetylase [Alphaproteobacteria bacterium]
MPLTPQGFPVMLSFDLDAETMWTARDAQNAERPIVMSQGAYGWKTGTPRVLDLLDRYAIKSTFFIPGLVIQEHQSLAEEILARGHEIAHHSWSHRWIVNLSPAEEREEMATGYEIIERVTGRPPAGYRSPAAEFSPITMGLLQEFGFSYSSNYFDCDEPYLHVVDGKQTDLVEFPFAWVLDDAPFFQYSITLPGRTMQAPSAVLEAWKAEFDMIYAEEGAFSLAMHPQIIGRPSRLVVLEALIEHISAQPNVWFARCDEVAAAVRPILRAGSAT